MDRTTFLKQTLAKNESSKFPTKKQTGNKWIELIVLSTGKVDKIANPSQMIPEKFTYEHKVLFRSDDPMVVLDYSDYNKVNPDINQTNHNIVLKLKDTLMEIVSVEEAEAIYKKLKQTIIGKGNSYLVIKDGKASSETIPVRLKERTNDDEK